jgi:ComF family protein
MGKAEALRLALTTVAKATAARAAWSAKATAARAGRSVKASADAATRTADALLAVGLAPPCAACAHLLEAPIHGPVCERCWAEAARAAGTYDGALRRIIHAFKYDGRRSLARPLGAILRSAGSEPLRDADCVVPVPLHPWRRFRRGFNQAADLARTLDVPVVHALWRTRYTVAQAGLTAAARRRNVRGAFRLSPLLSPRTRRRLIHDRVVVLVDDVATTGATMDACAEVLRRAGARDVRALTLARAAIRGPARANPF